MGKKEEYLMLREEIMASMDTVKNYRTMTYTIVSALLAFAFDKGSPWLFLIPFTAIIPLYLLAMHQIDSTMRIGAYIYVFLEPETDFQWETNLLKYDLAHKNQYSTKKSSIDPYVIVSMCCLALSVANLDFSNFLSFNTLSCIVVQILLASYSYWCFTVQRVDYIKSKRKYIREWRTIKENTYRNPEYTQVS